MLLIYCDKWDLLCGDCWCSCIRLRWLLSRPRTHQCLYSLSANGHIVFFNLIFLTINTILYDWVLIMQCPTPIPSPVHISPHQPISLLPSPKGCHILHWGTQLQLWCSLGQLRCFYICLPDAIIPAYNIFLFVMLNRVTPFFGGSYTHLTGTVGNCLQCQVITDNRVSDSKQYSYQNCAWHTWAPGIWTHDHTFVRQILCTPVLFL